MNYTLENVTTNIDLWFNKDPVRPELSVDFRITPGREIYGLKDTNGRFQSFLCLAYTTIVPTNTEELDSSTSRNGHIAVPYTVWRYERGAGREIVSQVLELLKKHHSVTRVITLSPPTDMARNFHIRNGAIEIQRNKETVNFEYSM